MSLSIAVSGATGRMGRAILELASQDDRFQVVGALEDPAHPAIGNSLPTVLSLTGKNTQGTVCSALADLNPAPKVLIDFTTPKATLGYLKDAVKMGVAMVIGTTGFSEAQRKVIRKAAGKVPVVMSSNMSTGMNILFSLAGKAASLLGPQYDVEIVEAHHHFKKDAPSGTALSLGESVALARGVKLSEVSTHGRHGLVGQRKKGSIGFHAVRGGDIVGDHTVLYAGPGERLELTHRAHSREALARGALRAALFLPGRKKGFFNMQDVLGLR
jgi:4-hydroxy-tetrahydrodipicolinate reductase